jgi:hypothetical protein
MTTFLLWNVQKKDLSGLVVRLVKEHRVGVVVLVERPERDEALLQALRETGRFTRVESHNRIGVYTRLGRSACVRLRPPVDDERMDFWHLCPGGRTDMLLAAVHGLDRVNYGDDRRGLHFQRLTANVGQLERQLNHKRTAVVGDFNASPFETAVAGALGLHAIRMSEVGGRDHRIIMQQRYEFFYNPMWTCYGRGDPSPPATYYFNGSDVYELFWRMLDQVVVRPQMLPYFPERSLRIVRRAGLTSLLTAAGLPNETDASDHLPLVFRIKLREAR